MSFYILSDHHQRIPLLFSIQEDFFHLGNRKKHEAYLLVHLMISKVQERHGGFQGA